jgi:hypothetical protein
MNKADLLKQIADTAYNVGFGAKKHFATYDIVEKIPGIIGFSSMAVGIFGLVFECLSTKILSALFLAVGVGSFYIERYDEKKEQFMKKGEELTRIFNELKALYYTVKSSTDDVFDKEQNEHNALTIRYCENCISNQILFSGWLAHYKFFWEDQIDWIDEQKHFKFWRDKVPLSFSLFVLLIMLIVTACTISCLCI